MIFYRYVFVGGLHRSGTSPLVQMIEDLPDVSGIRDAPVPEREGVYLQGAIPHTAQHGMPMHFASDPAQHHIEGSLYDTLDTRERLEADWTPWFAPNSRWRAEKSPVNLTRTRLYQQLFPLSQFVLILRHPQAVYGAVSKWVEMERESSVDHWLAAHDTVAQDINHLHHVMVIRYEDLVADPWRYRRAIAAFLQVDPGERDEARLTDRNGTYPGWDMPERQKAALERWGYGDDMATHRFRPVVRHALNSVATQVQRELGLDP